MPDDSMQDWTPKVFGLIPLGLFVDSTRLTATEGRLLDNLARDRGLRGLETFRDIKDEAFAVSEQRVPTTTTIPPGVEAQIAALPPEQQDVARALYPTNDGHTDAFRHAYWSARLTAEFGVGWAEQFTVAHEGVPGNPGIREAMDLYNNEVGRDIAVANPDASPAELADLIEQALNDGRLVVIDQSGHLAWSNAVARGNHGMTPSDTAPGVMAQPDGSASAH